VAEVLSIGSTSPEECEDVATKSIGD